MTDSSGKLRGYFGIGVEGISKPMNVGNLFRSAHAFGASFVFWLRPHHTAFGAASDTSRVTRGRSLFQSLSSSSARRRKPSGVT